MTPDELKAARATLCLSASDMAKALGLGDKARVYEYEAGTRRPSGSALILYRIYLRSPDVLAEVMG